MKGSGVRECQMPLFFIVRIIEKDFTCTIIMTLERCPYDII